MLHFLNYSACPGLCVYPVYGIKISKSMYFAYGGRDTLNIYMIKEKGRIFFSVLSLLLF